jgi:hypothetical protein
LNCDQSPVRLAAPGFVLEVCGEEIVMPAILRTGDWLGSGAQSSLTFSANEANFRERSQRAKS